MTNRILTGMVAVAGLLVGCASPGYHEGDQASAEMRATAAESMNTQQSIDAAWKDLDVLLNAKEGDLRPAFDRFAGHADSLKKAVDALQSRTTSMSSAATSYLSRWERELRDVKNEDLRNRSLQRRAAVEERVRKVKELAAQTKGRADECLSDLADVRRVLGTDLTLGGVATVQDAAARARASSASLREMAVKLTAELDGLGSDIASPPAPPKPETKPETKAESKPDSNASAKPAEATK